MALHPTVQQYLEQEREVGRPKRYELSPEEARAETREIIDIIGDGPAVAMVEDIRVPVRDGEIPARTYGPGHSHATIVWFHGGGWVMCDLDTHDAMCRTLANAADCTVVSVAYRLAPEHRFPVALDDCWDALSWAAKEYPSSPLVVGGDSAGGNMAAVCAVRARDRGALAIAMQVLVYPVTGHDMTTVSYIEHAGDDTLLGMKSMEWFFDHYIPEVADRDNPEASPLLTPDLSNLPPAIVVIAEHDPLRDEGRAYAERLRQARVDVTTHYYEDMPHPFFSLGHVFARGDEAVEQVGRDIQARV